MKKNGTTNAQVIKNIAKFAATDRKLLREAEKMKSKWRKMMKVKENRIAYKALYERVLTELNDKSDYIIQLKTRIDSLADNLTKTNRVLMVLEQDLAKKIVQAVNSELVADLRKTVEYHSKKVDSMADRILELRNGEPDNYKKICDEQKEEIERLKNIIRGKTQQSFIAVKELD
jgi:hypothetical protein